MNATNPFPVTDPRKAIPMGLGIGTEYITWKSPLFGA
jgi:hypothetical protein